MRHRPAPAWRAAASRLVLPTAIFVLWAVAAQPASATITYQYIGSPYTAAFSPYDTSMRIDATITLTSPLPNNAPLQDFSSMVTGYTFTDGVHSSFFAPPFTSFAFQTDANGSIVAWDISGPVFSGPAFTLYRLYIRNPPHPADPTVFDTVLFEDYTPARYAYSTAPGTWMLGPEPSVMTLSGVGLVVLAVIARRRACSSAAA